ncbi:GIY-YIG nuclease family protein [Azospirillum sp. sgz302134]
MSQKADDYRVVRCAVFTGRFLYDGSVAGYIPEFSTKSISHNFANRIISDQQNRITSAWKKIEPHLVSNNGGYPILYYSRSGRHVYFMQCNKTNLIKIGVSSEPYRRRKEINRQNSSYIKMLHIIPNGGRMLEAALHSKFAKHRHSGEWFHPSKEIFSFISQGT